MNKKTDLVKDQTMDCDFECTLEDDHDIFNKSSDEEGFEIIGLGRYKMTVENPWEMEHPWR